MFAHLSALLGGVVPPAGPASVGCFIGPLVIWLVKKDTMPFVDDQGKEALNFNITVAIAFFALLLLTIVTFGIGLFIAIPGLDHDRHLLAGDDHRRFRIKANEGVHLPLSDLPAPDQVTTDAPDARASVRALGR